MYLLCNRSFRGIPITQKSAPLKNILRSADLLRLYDLKLELSVTVQYLTVTRKNPFQIGCADRIFAF